LHHGPWILPVFILCEKRYNRSKDKEYIIKEKNPNLEKAKIREKLERERTPNREVETDFSNM